MRFVGIGRSVNITEFRVVMDVKVFFGGVLGRITFIRVVLIEIVWWIKIRGINVDIVDLGSVFVSE